MDKMEITDRAIKLAEKEIFISCVVPVFNEEMLIEKFIHDLITKMQTLTKHFEIIIVDDGSKDNTRIKLTEIKKHNGIKLIYLSRNFGKEIALTAGIEHSLGEIVILIDADFQHPIAMIDAFIGYWTQGYDMVYGVRTRRNEGLVKRYFSHFYYWLMGKITKIDMPSNAGDFRLLDKKIVAAFQQFPERTRFMKGLYAWIGFKKIGIPFDVPIRQAGASSWGFFRLSELAITGITSFSNVPLRIWGFIGFLISFVSLVYAIYIVGKTLIFGTDLPGFPTLVVGIMFLGGVQLLSIGILGEYIARIFTEVKQRPKYLIENKDGFD